MIAIALTSTLFHSTGDTLVIVVKSYTGTYQGGDVDVCDVDVADLCDDICYWYVERQAKQVSEYEYPVAVRLHAVAILAPQREAVGRDRPAQLQGTYG